MNFPIASDSIQPVFYENEDFVQLQNFLKQQSYSRYFVLMDENTSKCCWSITQYFFPKERTFTYTISCGEASKDLKSCEAIWTQLIESAADRKTLFVNLGGGVVSDLGAFAASIYKRGIDFINIPTSLLGMIDASIGGKCGIDFQYFKNQLGVFNFSKANFIFSNFLKTLPEQELYSGFAEALKHALIADAAYFQQLKRNLNDGILWDLSMIQSSIEIKNSIVSEDPKEEGNRKKLNFGHTIGHAIESYFFEKNQVVPHGYAIAAGMICESYLSLKHCDLSENEFAEINQLLLENYKLPKLTKTAIPEILVFMQHDKKRAMNQHQFVLLTKIGEAEIDCVVAEESIVSSIAYYIELQ